MEGLSADATGVIFDLDGTLVETAPDLHRAVVDTLAEMGKPPLSPDVIRSFVGHGVSHLISRVIATSGLDPADQDRCEQMFVRIYTADPARFSTSFPGVVAALEALAHFRLGICTNKPMEPTGTILSALDLEHHFDAVVCGDTALRRKPDPSGLIQVRDMLGADRIIHVGDSETDGETARRAGVPFLLFTGGYRSAAIEDIPHIASFDHFDDLPDLLSSLSHQTARTHDPCAGS